MNKLNVYQRAITLYGDIFSRLKKRESRYFLASVKFDFVFFLFALLWKSGNLDKRDLKKNSKIGNRFFPRNFNEWRFDGRFILFGENDSNFWDIDKDYFRKDKIIKRSGQKLAVLTYGLDLEKIFTLEEIAKERKIGAVIDWKGDLKENLDFKVVKKSQIFFNFSFYYFLLKNVKTLFKIHSSLKNFQTNLTLFDFLRYFIYCAFVSARIRAFLKILSKDESIGKVIFSDIDNTWGNSFLFWSYFYGFQQICYPHGSSLYFNKNRYFSPEICYVYTAYHQKVIEKEGYLTKTILCPAGWLKKYSLFPERVQKEKISNIALVTGMEKNLEVPFSDKEVLMDYVDALCCFVSEKNLSLTIKSHKLLDWHKEYDDFAVKYACVKHIKERWGMEDIQKIDLAVLMNPETTLILQFLFMGIPVITCAEVIPEIWTEHFSAPTFQFVVKTKKELLELIEAFLTDKEFYKKAQEEAQAQGGHFFKKIV